jgi:hypothetical protein
MRLHCKGVRSIGERSVAASWLHGSKRRVEPANALLMPVVMCCQCLESEEHEERVGAGQGGAQS